MVIDANTGKVLHSESGYARRYPASLTKMMTLYMAFDLIEQGRMSYDTLITISKHAANAPPSKLGLKPGSRISFRNAAKALAVKSANDIARAVAEHIGGSEANFARMMTRKARSIGMRSTTFRNASGLPDSGQTSTARDMITLALRLQDEFPKHYKLFKTKTFSYRGKRYRSYNTLLGRFRGTDGIKTGYTRASGFNLVSSVRRDGKHVVAAVFGGRTSRARNAKMRALLRRGLSKASRRKTRRQAPLLISRAKPAKRLARQRYAVRRAPPPQRKPQGATTQVTRHQNAARKAPTIKIANVRAIRTVPTPRPAQRVQISDAAPTPPAFQPRRIPAQANAAVEREDLQNFASTFSANADTANRQNWTAQARPPSRDGAPRGRRPSTLQEQMAALENRSMQQNAYQQYKPRPPGNGQFSTPVTSNRRYRTGSFIVQIGAYSSQNEARDRLSEVSRSAAGLLDGYQPRTERAERGNKSIYRARFAGFDSTSASSTCKALRRRGIDCFATRSD